MDGWDEKKGGYVCAWLVEERKEEEEIGQNCPTRGRESELRERKERELANQEKREGEDGQPEKRKGGKEGESGAGDRPDPLGPFLTRSAPMCNFDDFHPFFRRIASRNFMGNTLGAFLYPFHLKIGEIWL